MWRVRVAGPASKALERLPRREQMRILAALEAMAVKPFTGDVKKLGVNSYRRRVGSYRIFFDLDRPLSLVQVIAITRRTSTTYRKRSRRR